MKIAYITIENPNHKHSWSGTNYYLLKALRKQFKDIDIFAPVQPRITLFFLKAVNYLTLRLLRKRFDYRHSTFLSKSYARIIERRLAKKKYDLIVAPTGNGLLAMVKTNVPIVYIADRTIKGAYNYHEQFKKLFDFSREQSFFIDSEIMRKAALICFPSRWAFDSAVRDYNVEREKLRMIPFGANLDYRPYFNPGVADHSELKLLFIGVNWKDKGGVIAYETLVALRSKGYKVKLVICGCNPPATIANDADVIDEGFLRKENEDEFALLLKHFHTADFLILPTRYEAYGLVFCEAAAHSLPVLATKTGGIPTIVEDGKTGFLFAPEDRGDKYADRIIDLIKDISFLEQLRRNSYNRYSTVLNWDAWLNAFISALEERNLIK